MIEINPSQGAYTPQGSTSRVPARHGDEREYPACAVLALMESLTMLQIPFRGLQQIFSRRDSDELYS